MSRIPALILEQMRVFCILGGWLFLVTLLLFGGTFLSTVQTRKAVAAVRLANVLEVQAVSTLVRPLALDAGAGSILV